jgi:predicted deacylase
MTVALNSFEFRGTSNGPHLLITGAVHGDEFEPILAIRRLIDLFGNRDDVVAGFKGRVTLIPIVNEAAFLRGHRCGDDGLDLARTCPGKPDGSLTEQTAFALSEFIRSADNYIDLHTGGTELAVYPLTGYVMHANESVLDVQRQMARAFNLPVVWGTAANLEGRSLSVARDASVPAIYCEYLGAATCTPDGTEAYVQGCLNVLAELGMLDRRPPANRVRYVVENREPNSGHMQVCNPSPITGYFEANVQLGDAVRSGDPLGTVHSLDCMESLVIQATQSGIVLVLRTFPRVRAGESVGVVMETESQIDS